VRGAFDVALDVRWDHRAAEASLRDGLAGIDACRVDHGWRLTQVLGDLSLQSIDSSR